jgi:hypothetical protein
MQVKADRPEAPSAIRSDLGAIFVSLELSRSTWLITSLSPGGGEKMSKHSVPAGDIGALLARFSEIRQKALARTGKSFPIIVICGTAPQASAFFRRFILRERCGHMSGLSTRSWTAGLDEVRDARG